MRERERERGKGVEAYGTSDLLYYTSSCGLPCKKHPCSSPIGVCAYCLRDRLLRLVCSDCGEQRLSSCSCSEIDTDYNRNSSVGSVGRMSLLIEKEKNPEAEDVVLKRSSSTCGAGMKKTGGLWKIGRLFKKKSSTEKSEMWVVDDCNGGVSRSRSVCSFRGANLYEDYLPVSAARSSVSGRRSGFSEAEPRRSGYGYNSEAEQQRKSSYSYNSEAEARKSSFSYNSEAEARKSNLDDQERKQDPNPNRRIFSLRETDFSSDSAFIDLKFDFSSNPEQQGVALSAFGSMRSGGDECRIGAGERGIKRSRKSFKGWGWIFKNHPNSTNATKKDLDHHLTFNPSYR